ncbi:hypothetical protein C8Q75DRAFT_740821 [Abortiporus biennis]|nr:hypothetical protein C8Q75DRAFT_740821 [Abortiporus biennis]
MLARISANSARRLPRVAPVARRFYAEEAFHKKEKAHEDQYVREHEKAQIEKLKKAIEQKKQELADLERQHAEKVNGGKSA